MDSLNLDLDNERWVEMTQFLDSMSRHETNDQTKKKFWTKVDKNAFIPN